MLTTVKAWLWLTRALDIGPAWEVLNHFGSPEKAYFADQAEYRLISKLTEKHLARLADKSLDGAERILADCDRTRVGILTWQDTEYPERLRNIELPPMVLYYKGRLPHFDDEIAVGMAGTRKTSPYGSKVAALLGFQIARLGGLVVSGVVSGCDEQAVKGALRAGGPVACVMAGGVDVPYYDSESSRRLLEDVAANGVLLSESPPGTPHLGGLFLSRNRILTGLCLGTVCVEAPERSGTLNVARLSLEQGRDVFAVPCNIDAPAGAGTNALLAAGEAICVRSGDDVLEHYWALYPQNRRHAPKLDDAATEQRLDLKPDAAPEAPRPQSKPKAPKPEPAAKPAPAPEPEKRTIRFSDHRTEYTDDEQAVLLALGDSDMITDDVVKATGLPARRVSATLTVLTIRGLVRSLPGGRFQAVARFIP